MHFIPLRLALPVVCAVVAGGIGPVALAGTAAQRDIRCREEGQYIGGIDRTWKLDIAMGQFSYQFKGLGAVTVRGTYEAKDGLATFTGSRDFADQKPPMAIRFSLTYAFIGDKVVFNVLRGEGGPGRYVCRRQTFHQADRQWLP